MELGDTFVKIARKHETTQYIAAKLSQQRPSMTALKHRDIACKRVVNNDRHRDIACKRVVNNDRHRDIACKRVVNNDRHGLILCVPRVCCSHVKLFCLNRTRKIRFPFTGARHRQQF